ncbi:MAG: ACP S-malonyltransferase [Candidatus Endonucleobacter bathymodioli]|uniref:Malonyl CoA-acyl carrier protein transacylase n=1 Tax=Candidatus Endonucleibacter bathymodioli TaxID=539814 RepID=A0AA90NJZ1_9GAMM|nr:ACP S-malonyltransferase [Candidatus Endonucleobacter bathymodioli]
MTDIFAFIFPGQGSQKVGMLAEYIAEPIFADTLCEASELLGLDLSVLFSSGPVEELNKTENTQPGLLAASVALWRLWSARHEGLRPSLMAGHSLGEYSALVCAGAMAFRDAITLVRNRGLYMQEAVSEGEGAMAAILGLSDSDVISVCLASAQGQVVEAVNFNSPGQVVIAGNREAVERAMIQAKDAGSKKEVLLPVSVPSHCALMKTAAEKLKAALENVKITSPITPVVQNFSAEACSEPEVIRNNLVAQLCSPVRWVETINAMYESGVVNFVECGPGKVLAGLNRRIVRQAKVVSLESLSSMGSAV